MKHKLFLGGVCICAILCLVVGLYALMHRAVWASVNRSWAARNLQAIHFALLSYEDDYGQLPPAIIRSQDGKPMHSWRVLILPYLGPDEAAIHRQYRFDEPWNGPHNILLARQMPEFYESKARTPQGEIETTFVAITDGSSVWRSGVVPRMQKDWQPVVVSVPDCRVNWLQPKDISLNGVKGQFDVTPLMRLHNSNKPILFICGLGREDTRYDTDGFMRKAFWSLLQSSQKTRAQPRQGPK